MLVVWSLRGIVDHEGVFDDFDLGEPFSAVLHFDTDAAAVSSPSGNVSVFPFRTAWWRLGGEPRRRTGAGHITVNASADTLEVAVEGPMPTLHFAALSDTKDAERLVISLELSVDLGTPPELPGPATVGGMAQVVDGRFALQAPSAVAPSGQITGLDTGGGGGCGPGAISSLVELVVSRLGSGR